MVTDWNETNNEYNEHIEHNPTVFNFSNYDRELFEENKKQTVIKLQTFLNSLRELQQKINTEEVDTEFDGSYDDDYRVNRDVHLQNMEIDVLGCLDLVKDFELTSY